MLISTEFSQWDTLSCGHPAAWANGHCVDTERLLEDKHKHGKSEVSRRRQFLVRAELLVQWVHRLG